MGHIAKPPAPAAATADTKTGLDNFFELLRLELTIPLARIAELATRLEELRAAGLMPATLAGEQAFAELVQVSRRSSEFIERLHDLGDLLADTPMEDDERLLLDSLVGEAAAGAGERARQQGVSLHLEEGKTLLAPVYGSHRWLATALRRLLDGLVATAPAGSHVVLRLRQVGRHQLIAGGVQAQPPAPGSRDLLRTARHRPTGPAGAATAAALDLELVHAIVETHGGMFKADVTEQGQLHQFTLTLPTGVAARKGKRQDTCSNCPLRQQTLQYASDLAELMADETATGQPLEESAS